MVAKFSIYLYRRVFVMNDDSGYSKLQYSVFLKTNVCLLPVEEFKLSR